MLSFFPLGLCLQSAWRDGGVERAGQKLRHIFASFQKLSSKMHLALFIVFVGCLFIFCYINSDKINNKLMNQRIKASLEIGETGITKRINWLANRLPQKILSNDGRLKQLISVKDEDFTYFESTSGIDDLTEYGYIVAFSAHVADLEKRGLSEHFVKDYEERISTIYIRRDVLAKIYGL
jgi:hypothetical protein